MLSQGAIAAMMMHPADTTEVVLGRTHRWWNGGTPDNAFYGNVQWDTTVENTAGAVVGIGFNRAPAGATHARILSQVWIDYGFGDAGKLATYEVRKNGIAVGFNTTVLLNGSVFVTPNFRLAIPQFEIAVVPGDNITGFTQAVPAPAGYIYIGDDPQWTYIIIDWLRRTP